MFKYKYFCRKCGYEREGLLDVPWGIGGYAWDCPKPTCHGDGNSFDITCEQKVFIPSKRINEDKYYTKKIIIKD